MQILPVIRARASSTFRVAFGRFVLCCALALMMHPASAQAPVGQAPFVTIEGDLKATAWWVLADFHPFTKEVRGIPVSQIRKNWCKATEFRSDLIPKELLFENGHDAMEEGGRFFALEGNFDGSATKQVALTGVYQECAGKKGSFVLILDQPINPGKPRIRFISTSEANRQFLALQKEKDDRLLVWTCMECDAFSILKWDRKKRKFAWLPQPDEE